MRQPGIAPATTAPPLVVCRNLFKIYQRASPEAAALRGLDLTVAPGELPAIISGSAIVKSTLLNTPDGRNAARNFPRYGPRAFPESRCG